MKFYSAKLIRLWLLQLNPQRRKEGKLSRKEGRMMGGREKKRMGEDGEWREGRKEGKREGKGT